MKSFYVTDLATLNDHAAGLLESHFLDLDGNKLIAAIRFRSEAAQDKFEADTRVEVLPSALAGGQVSQKQASYLAKQGIVPGESIHSAVAKLKKFHP